MKNFILKNTPVYVQNFTISLYNSWLYRKRHGGLYRHYRNYYAKFDNAPKEVIDSEKDKRLVETLRHALTNSSHYRRVGGDALENFPILEKVTLLKQLDEISTISEENAEVSL